MRKSLRSTLLIASLLCAPAIAAPSLVAQAEIAYGDYEFIEQVQIQGDIQDSLLQLVDKQLEDKSSAVYVIDEIAENTAEDTFTVLVSLYDIAPNGFAHQFGEVES
ncbi:hypothetical protein [Thaumasiovibrio subtropicus]|uniref:hypothetical protein n=1 Tax=Thaumasiovibrio subtropicus TaxID=1891207 RepID=UPI00131B5305|nr:hypothetical protein [Thaumasiovibrio subtropicus]